MPTKCTRRSIATCSVSRVFFLLAVRRISKILTHDSLRSADTHCVLDSNIRRVSSHRIAHRRPNDFSVRHRVVAYDRADEEGARARCAAAVRYGWESGNSEGMRDGEVERSTK